ncbi:hypothetical protein M413DRAFT_442252 [Hebeloma cylindrosporum]|uniref:Sensor domain-containing protein n=1 Tax=Hebeloma cylindrosporum TaxID=76867 RepID=A0A0C2YXB1_HEBCY|nr:hypothetical protein M413DRAFT_442252 [Hebeloma cylindrosporum h7]
MAVEPPPPTNGVDDAAITDPPPPYPSRERRTRVPRASRHGHTTIQTSQHSGDTISEHEARISPYTDEGYDEPNETTPFLTARAAHTQHHHQRPRSHSHTSTISASPSLAHTFTGTQGGEEPLLSGIDAGSGGRPTHSHGFCTRAAWRRYFRPLGILSYYKAFFHLLVLNFLYGLAAWIYLFVLTVTGTTLLVALPLGAVLCFFDLLGARAFSRGELALQRQFHAPLSIHRGPYHPHPIFTRYREPTPEELESSHQHHPPTRNGLVRENSFYKNTYTMFTDPTSYQALFYFLVIKPFITLSITVAIIAVGVPLFILVLPAPAVLRAVRKIGIWQANVAVEGLYVPVR